MNLKIFKHFSFYLLIMRINCYENLFTPQSSCHHEHCHENNGHCGGPGYASPMDAMKHGPREKLMYVICIQPDENKTSTDYLATIDVDPTSNTYCKVISRTYTGNKNDELHHMGWNVCSSCHKDCNKKRDKLIMPSLKSDRIYVVDVGLDPKNPTIHKVIDAEEMHKFNCSTPHTTHCTSTEIMISIMGDKDGNAKCDFLLIDPATYKIKGTWVQGDNVPKFGYDFWYQPYFDVMVSSEWGEPKTFKKGFNPAESTNPKVYGKTLNFFNWTTRMLESSFDLGEPGWMPLEVRFHHNPKSSIGYVGCALNGNVYGFQERDGSWDIQKVISIPPIKVTGWISDTMSSLITDILISMDDRFLYFSNWLHGTILQYDIKDPMNPKLVGTVLIGGKLLNDSSIQPVEMQAHEPVVVKGTRIYGGPQMLQLSLDGKRLYVTTSLFSPWDKQIYPDMVKSGSVLLMIDVDNQNGGLKLNKDFIVNFGKEPDGPILAHEMRYPGGDCTSDIWLPNA